MIKSACSGANYNEYVYTQTRDRITYKGFRSAVTMSFVWYIASFPALQSHYAHTEMQIYQYFQNFADNIFACTCKKPNLFQKYGMKT